MKRRTFTCIVCPNGCTIEAVWREGEEIRIDGAALPLCSVRLNRAIPKGEIFRVMEEIGRVRLTAPVRIGQVVIGNVCGLDADVIVTKNMEKVRT